MRPRRPPPRVRLSGGERRAAIVRAALPLFAAQGFEGVKSRALAEAAGVSEALLYKHFPGKDALYLAVRQQGHGAADEPALRRFAALPPSTEKLVLAFHLFLRHMVVDAAPAHMTLPRLMLRSLLEDGEFARANLRRFRAEWFSAVVEAVDAARREGDLDGDGARGEVGIWLLHHLGFALKVMAMPRRPAVEYGVSRRQLTEQAVRFALRGLGLTEAAIRRYYRPAKLEKLLR